MKKYDRVPLPGYLYFFIFFCFFGVDGIIKQDIRWTYFNIHTYFHDTGYLAIYGGIFFILFGLFFGFYYFRNIKNEIVNLFKSKSKLNIVYVVWFLTIMFPAISNEFEFNTFFWRLSFISIFVLNLYFTIKFHLRIKKMVLDS